MNLLRYLRLYSHFVSFSLQKAMQFRLDFFFRIVMDGLFYAVNLGLYWVVFEHTDGLAGWNLSQALVFVSGYLVIDAVHMTLFSNNLHFFPILVNKGELDYYLLRPVSSLFFLSMREFAFNSLVNLLMAGGIMVWALTNLTTPFGPWDLALFLGALCLGVFLHYAIHLTVLLQVFWTDSADGAAQLHYNMTKFSERPDAIFPSGLRLVLVTVLPYALIASFPARIFFAESIADRGWLLLHMAGACVGFGVLLLILWKKGLRTYSSASS